MIRVQVALLTACVAWLAGAFIIGNDFRRMAQLYIDPPHRLAQWRDLTAREVSQTTGFFVNPAEFAWLTTTTVNEQNAVQMHAMARRLLHYSPEPRVITKLITSAQLLGLQADVQEQTQLLERAYPDASKTFREQQEQQKQKASAASQAGSSASQATPEGSGVAGS